MLDNIKRLEQENAELKEEVKQLHNCRNPEELYTLFGKPIKYWEELRADNKHLNDLLDNALKEQEELRAENDRLKQESKELAHYLACMTEQRNKANTYLQEIKAIAKTGMHCEGMGCDFMPKILDLITKAEEE